MPKRAPIPRPADQPLPAVQERSQATLDRLLAAAEALLREGGPDAATLRAIAERAGVSVGIVYRRFPDKDAVLRSVCIRCFDRAARANDEALAPERWRDVGLREMARKVIRGIAAGYRTNRHLLRALILYGRTHDDAEFRRVAESLNGAVFERLGALFVDRRRELRHPDPALGVRYAVAAAAAALQAQILFTEPSSRTALPHDVLVDETTRAFVRYLGIRDGG